jgi:NADH-quinone oxidoreductase subunit C
MEVDHDIREALDAIASEFEGKVEAAGDLRGEPLYLADRSVAHDLIERFKSDERTGCNCLVFITGQDNYLDEPRFEVVYCVRSLERNFDVRIKVPVPGEEPEVASLCDLFPSANWLEREVWDMFGVRFAGHPNLERILMWEGFEGHPLRKDYPLLGNTPGTPGYIGKGGKL